MEDEGERIRCLHGHRDLMLHPGLYLQIDIFLVFGLIWLFYCCLSTVKQSEAGFSLWHFAECEAVRAVLLVRPAFRNATERESGGMHSDMQGFTNSLHESFLFKCIFIWRVRVSPAVCVCVEFEFLYFLVFLGFPAFHQVQKRVCVLFCPFK